MAIIDILQHYDAKKKAAHAAKTVKHGVCSCVKEQFEWFCSNTDYKYNTDLSYKTNILHVVSDSHLCIPLQAGAEISTVNPEQYSKRFHDFITTILS